MTLDIAAIKARAEKASGQSWQVWNMVHGDTGKPMSPDELGEYVKNNVLKSIEDGGSADQFLFVSFDGEGNPDICHVGNGPNRAANASFIAHARTDIPALIAALEASEAARVKAEQERDAETAAFKNFHRMLCERFDCHVHDEIDWKRDQVSLMEWIAKRITALEAERDALKAALKPIHEAHDEFKEEMGDNWEGDPLSDAIEASRRVLESSK